jgi:CHASE1-domain containing sensor protein
VLGVGILMTAGAAWSVGMSSSQSRERRLEVNLLRVTRDLKDVVLAHGALLAAMRSLYLVGSGAPSAEQFARFVAGGRLLEQYPGAQALEFARRSPPDDGLVDRWVVEHIVPVAGNEAVQGVDLSREANRRAAIESACERDRPTATGPVRLVQERGDSPGLVVFGPVYAADVSGAGPADRARACSGVMIVVYRVQDMVAPLRVGESDVELELYDRGPLGAENGAAARPTRTLLFDSNPAVDASRRGPRRSGIEFHGRQWEVVVAPRERCRRGRRRIGAGLHLDRLRPGAPVGHLPATGPCPGPVGERG